MTAFIFSGANAGILIYYDHRFQTDLYSKGTNDNLSYNYVSLFFNFKNLIEKTWRAFFGSRSEITIYKVDDKIRATENRVIEHNRNQDVMELDGEETQAL